MIINRKDFGKLSLAGIFGLNFLKGNAAEYLNVIMNIKRANLIRLWPLWDRFDGARDYINRVNGTYNGPTLNAANFRNTYYRLPYFDGINDNITVITNLSTQFNVSVGSLMCWVRRVGGWSAQGDQSICDFRNAAADRIYIRVLNNSTLVEGIYRSLTTNRISDYDVGATSDFFLVVLNWNVATFGVELFINGVSGGQTAVPSVIPAINQRAYIGSLAASPAIDFWNGNIGFFTIWAGANLGQVEINRLYNSIVR